jgi:hypothetical protein
VQSFSSEEAEFDPSQVDKEAAEFADQSSVDKLAGDSGESDDSSCVLAGCASASFCCRFSSFFCFLAISFWRLTNE